MDKFLGVPEDLIDPIPKHPGQGSVAETLERTPPLPPNLSGPQSDRPPLETQRPQMGLSDMVVEIKRLMGFQEENMVKAIEKAMEALGITAEGTLKQKAEMCLQELG